MAVGRTNAQVSKGLPKFTFTVGSTTYNYDGHTDFDNSAIKTVTDGTTKTLKCWLKTSGTLYFRKLPKSEKARVFACGAGGTGSDGVTQTNAYSNSACGTGGAGGYTATNTDYDIPIRTQLSISVGSGATTGLSLSAAKGANGVTESTQTGGTGSGGKGASSWTDYLYGTGTHFYSGETGGNGVYAFGDSTFDGIRYGAGGGGGGNMVDSIPAYSGGATGGGHGNTQYGAYSSNVNGQANTGAGGGGSGAYAGTVNHGSGGTGILIFQTLVPT